MIIIFARHGQTTGDVEDRYGGDYDDILTTLGRQQAQDLADRLAKFAPKGLVSSPLIRAMQTASIVGDSLGLVPEMMRSLKERNSYGVLTGLTKAEAKEKFPQEVVKVGDYKQTIEDAEEYRLFGRRLISVFYRLLRRAESPVLVITHGGVIRFLYRELLLLGEVEVDDCAYVVIEAEGKKLKKLTSKGIRKKK